jgi:iron complex outermembrane receptor protein
LLKTSRRQQPKKQPKTMNNYPMSDWTATGREIRSAVLAAMLLLLASTNVSAQQATSAANAKEDENRQAGDSKDETVKLDKFIVTTDHQEGYGARQAVVGSRLAKDIIDIAANVNVATPELINDLGGTNGPLAVTFVSADVRFNDNTDDGNTMRGFSASGSTLRNGTSYIWYKRIPMYDVERIEVVKGPANMLLGGSAGSTGGAINYVTKLPTTTFQSDAKVTIGSNSLERFEANVSGPLTQSKEFTALYRLTVGQEHGDPVRPMNKLDDRFVGGALRFDFGDRIRLDFNGYYLVDNSNDYWPAFLDVVRSVPHGPAVLNPYSTDTFGPGRPDQEFWDTNSHALDLTLTMSLTDNATLRLNYTDLSGHDKRRNLRGGAVQADNVTLTRQDILQYLYRYTRAAQAEFLYQTVRTTWRNDFQIGTEVRQSFDRTYDDLLPAPSLNTSNPDLSYNVPNVTDWDAYYYNLARNTQKSNLSSYWTQDHLTLFNDRVVIVGGLRWNSSNSVAEKGNPVILPGNLAGPYVISKQNDPMVRTHRYGIVVKPLKDLSVYYTDAQNSTVVPGFGSDNAPFKNSTGTLHELGAKLIRGNERFSFSGTIAAYDMAQTQIRISIIDATVPGGIRYTQSPTGDTSKGWETELVGRLNGPLGHLDALVNYSHGHTLRAIDGRPATNAPDTTESVFLKYTWTGGIFKGLAMGAGMYDESVINTGAYTIDQPAIYNIMARYDLSPRWALQLNGTNVTDKKYLASVLNTGLVQVAPRADYQLSAKYKW